MRECYSRYARDGLSSIRKDFSPARNRASSKRHLSAFFLPVKMGSSSKDDALDDTNAKDLSKSTKKKEKKEKKKKKEKESHSSKRNRPEKVTDEEQPKKKNKKEKRAKKEKKKKKEKEKEKNSNRNRQEQRVGVGKEKDENDFKEGKQSAQVNDNKIVQSSAVEFIETKDQSFLKENDVALLLFYQYVEPPWDSEFYSNTVLSHMQKLGDDLQLTGRMRVAKEGLNCTLTSSYEKIIQFCKALRGFHNGEFADTEFKVTTDLPKGQRFPNLKVMPVAELVHYGLDGEKAPPIEYTGTHLDPNNYHEKLAEDNTVVIDVRNHYEASIGRFAPPDTGAEYMDPLMRKSTEFPLWLDKPETKEKLKGKQVLMYCTGGVRCERASALLKYKMDTDPGIKDLGIQGVYQLQGGIDKYFKQFPEGGFWKGKNYTFDKRFAHAPAKIEVEERSGKTEQEKLGKCEACSKPWDMFRGKRRCPTCGVPSLICRDCFQADRDKSHKIDRSIRCDLCVEQNVMSKAQLREKEEKELQEYLAKVGGSSATSGVNSREKPPKKGKLLREPAPNPDGVTRLFLKNMCRKDMNEALLIETLPGVTHIVWRTDRKSGQFSGQAWVEMATSEDAARAVGMNGKRVLNRPLYVEFQPPDGKDAWPPRSSKVDQ